MERNVAITAGIGNVMRKDRLEAIRRKKYTRIPIATSAQGLDEVRFRTTVARPLRILMAQQSRFLFRNLK
jgi:hypothetical protein